MNIKQAKNILLTELLARLNVFPAKISGDLAMYFAINREEIVPSLSVSLKKNTALDFGTGKVYDSISLVQEIKKCSVSEALKIISEMDFSSSFQKQENLEEIEEYKRLAALKSDFERSELNKEKTGVEMVHNHESKTYVNIVVHNRKQIAQIIRDLRMHFGFPRITRLAQPINISEASKAS